MSAAHELDANGLRSLFDRPRELALGIEEEVMALDPATLDLAPRARDLLAPLDGDPAFKLEMPASQIEIVTPPRATVATAVEDLAASRARLVSCLAGEASLAAAGVHPFAAAEGELNEGPRNQRLAEEYGPVARRQLVCGLHVHVGLSGAERALAVFNAARSWLPELAALGANAPLWGGQDSGMASVRPLISGLLPRQGVPPAYSSWEELAGDLRWGNRAGRLERLLGWWWELRLHGELGTVELRVPDAQSTVADAGAVAAVGASLLVWLAERHDADDLGPPDPSWRIAENRWSAARHGLDGTLLDLRTGQPGPTRERLAELLDSLSSTAQRIGAGEQLGWARSLVESNGACRQRALLVEGDARSVVAELSRHFAEPPPSSATTAPGGSSGG
jgi:carboxylate-amine ligase